MCVCLADFRWIYKGSPVVITRNVSHSALSEGDLLQRQHNDRSVHSLDWI